MSVKIIGIGATSRVGKDTLAGCLTELFRRDGFTVNQYSLALELKADVADFLREKCNINVWSNDTEEKSKCRDFLVSYGRIQRKRTLGKYWTGLVQRKIESDSCLIQGNSPLIAIVSDIR